MSVFHLQYRPKSIEELDLPKVRESLAKLLVDLDKIPHSLLFCGPKGSGKTSAARVVARVINEIKVEDEQNYMDIVELDAASNRGIDDIRNLREKVYLSPTQLKWKVFIIDEVHMLTKEAFNAFLKLLEEPPTHTMFILCTTEAGDIPETVMSRLVRVDFKRAEDSEIAASLGKVEKAEKLELEKGILEAIIAQSDGSFRNATRLLNELVLQYGKKIKLEEVSNFFVDKTGNYGPKDLEKDLISKDVLKIINNIEQEAEAGVDMESWMEKLVTYFQKQLVDGNSVLETSRLSLWLSLLIGACRQQKDSPIAQLPIQLAVAEFLKDEKKVQSVGAAVAPIQPEQEIVIKSNSVMVGCDLQTVTSSWVKIIGEVSLANTSVAAFLRSSKAKELSGDDLVVEVFYAFHQERLAEAKNNKLIELCMERVLGTPLRVEFRLGDTSKRVAVVKEQEMPEPQVVLTVEKPGDELYAVAKEIFG